MTTRTGYNFNPVVAVVYILHRPVVVELMRRFNWQVQN